MNIANVIAITQNARMLPKELTSSFNEKRARVLFFQYKVKHFCLFYIWRQDEDPIVHSLSEFKSVVFRGFIIRLKLFIYVKIKDLGRKTKAHKRPLQKI